MSIFPFESSVTCCDANWEDHTYFVSLCSEGITFDYKLHKDIRAKFIEVLIYGLAYNTEANSNDFSYAETVCVAPGSKND